MRSKGYSLWLMPSGEAYGQLADLISTFSRKFGAPYFDPHITLIGEIIGERRQIIEKSAVLAAQIRPINIVANNISVRNEYFMRLFINTTLNTELMAANIRSRKLFKREADSEYPPHISLLYSDSPPPESFISQTLEFLPLELMANTIKLIDANGEPEDWKELERFALG